MNESMLQRIANATPPPALDLPDDISFFYLKIIRSLVIERNFLRATLAGKDKKINDWTEEMIADNTKGVSIDEHYDQNKEVA